MIRNQIRAFLFERAQKRISKTINAYTKSFYPDFDFNQPVEGEIEHVQKWSGFLSFPVDPLYYRLYSTLSGVRSINYVPDDVYVIFLLKLLNQDRIDHAFRDKNLYDLFPDSSLFPKVYVRKVKGAYLDAEYAPIKDVDDVLSRLAKSVEYVIVKPTVDTASGKNVRFFQSDGIRFSDQYGAVLDCSLLNTEYQHDFAVQERVRQEEAVARFNPQSINTVRVYTYRSVVDDDVHTLSFSLRVGKKGKSIDNLNGGGYGIGVSPEGELSATAINKFAHKVESINGQDLGKKLTIPHFNEFSDIAQRVAARFVYDRFLGLDIFRDIHGNMRVMEVNLGHIGTDLPHLLGMPLFGPFTDEVIEYCRAKKASLTESYKLQI